MNIDPRPEFGSFAFAGARGCVLRKSKCAKSYLEVSFCSIMLFDIALAITFGGMCRLPQLRGGACFCTRDAMQGYDVICLFSRWQKP